MAIDFQQVYQKIKEIGSMVKERQRDIQLRQVLARKLLGDYATDLDGLRYKVGRALEADPNLRCALPVDEPLDFHAAPPELPVSAVLIAADGSQINPDRHMQVQYGLINVGALVYIHNSGQAPLVSTLSELLFDTDLLTSDGRPLNESMVALRRDKQERQRLFDLAGVVDPGQGPIVTFTDGPLELWGERDGDNAAEFEKKLAEYLNVLRDLCRLGITTAGYVDKPSSDLVARLLEIAIAGPDDLQALRRYHPLLGVSDRWLYGEKGRSLLPPGERSAVFAIQTRSEKYYNGSLALHFFYLNVGTKQQPWPVRVEIPAWVARDPAKLGLLHAVLLSQCRLMGSNPYPYLLHRAHETAVVTLQERQQLEQMLMLELRRQDAELDDGSYKQAAKDLPGRSSY
jgi:hypothetical protein